MNFNNQVRKQTLWIRVARIPLGTLLRTLEPKQITRSAASPAQNAETSSYLVTPHLVVWSEYPHCPFSGSNINPPAHVIVFGTPSTQKLNLLQTVSSGTEKYPCWCGQPGVGCAGCSSSLPVQSILKGKPHLAYELLASSNTRPSGQNSS